MATDDYLTLASQRERAGDYQGARELYERAIEAGDQRGDSVGGARLLLLGLLDRIGDDEAVLALADELDGKGPIPASGRVAVVISAAMNIARTQAYSRTERYPEAVVAGRAAIADIERDGVVAGPVRLRPYDAWYRLGHALRSSGDPMASIAAFLRAAELEPSDAEPHFQLGCVYKDVGDAAAAVAAAERALDLAPHDGDCHYNLACYHSLVGDRQRALASLSRAIQIDASNATVALEDDDFASLHVDPAFQRLVRASPS